MWEFLPRGKSPMCCGRLNNGHGMAPAVGNISKSQEADFHTVILELRLEGQM